MYSTRASAKRPWVYGHAPWWPPKHAGREWRWLWEIYQWRQVYNVDDHHWALLFDALRLAIAAANDATAPDQLFLLGLIRVGSSTPSS